MNIEHVLSLLEMQKSCFKEVLEQNNKNLAQQCNEEEAKNHLSLHFNLVLMESANNQLLESIEMGTVDQWNKISRMKELKPSTI